MDGTYYSRVCILRLVQYAKESVCISRLLFSVRAHQKNPPQSEYPFFLRRPGTDNKQMANGTGAENSGRNTGIEMGAELDASSERGEGGGPGSAPAAALAAALANTAGRSSSPPPSPHLIPPDCDADANADDGPPVANIMQGSSSTSSSLSAQSMDGDGGDGDGDGEEDGMDPLLGDAFGGAAAGQGSGLRARGAPGRPFSASTPKRKMSEGSSPQREGSPSGPGEAAAGRAAAAAAAAGDAASSSGTPASSIYSSSRGGTASDSVNWGWFENVHSSTNFLGGVGASSSDQDLGRVPKGGKTKKKKKKGGLLQFSPAVGGQIHVDLRTLHKEQQGTYLEAGRVGSQASRSDRSDSDFIRSAGSSNKFTRGAHHMPWRG